MPGRLVAFALLMLAAGCATPPDATPPPAGSPGPTLTPSSPVASASEPPGSAGAEPATWTRLEIAGPAAREDHTWTVGGDGRTAYLFGGRDGATVFDDLWQYDLELDSWRQVGAAPGPAGRFGHEAVWVDDVGLVVYAGQSGSTFFSDLWAFWPPAGTWSELDDDGVRPVSRYGTCAALGPDGRLWISHGFTSDGARFSDTWAYDFASHGWADETPQQGDHPVERCLHGCWWTDAGELALYAGQTTGVTALGDRWVLLRGRWARVDGHLPPERNLYARARLNGGMLVFGGQARDGGYLADLWLLADGEADARALPVAESPPARAGAEMVRDGDRLLLFGGRNADGTLGDMWELRGSVLSDG